MSLYFIFTYLVVILGTINLVRMGIFLVGSDIYGLKQTLRKNKLTQADLYTPTFSVVIPAHNEERTIENTLTTVINSEYPKEKLQIIVVDDGSTDSTVAIIKKLKKSAAFKNVTLIQQENAGKAHALNNAMRNHAQGDIIMCLDADSSVLSDSIQNAAQYFVDTRVVALSANVKIRPMKSFLNLIQRYEYLVCYQMKRAHTLFNIEYIIGGIASTFRRSALEKVGFYDTDTITEDIDLTFKLLRDGNKDNRVLYGADVVSYTESVLSIKDLIKQRFRWKHGRAQTFLKNLDLFFSRSNRHNPFLTWVYLPYALFSDLAFFLEPFLIGFIAYVVIAYADWATLVSAFAVVGSYVMLNVIAEDTIPWKQRIKMAFVAPSMYFFFYILSYVEYVALIRSYGKIGQLLRKDDASCSWDHVERATIKSAGQRPSFIPVPQVVAVFAGIIVSTSVLTYVFHKKSAEGMWHEGTERIAHIFDPKVTEAPQGHQESVGTLATGQ
jgi:poly-beta-1,6-N-acetyl-D-glucosamine synthase